MKALQCIHNAGYVHGDIRKENLIFDTSGQKAWIIDFDMARKENEPYVSIYNDKVEGRHPDAEKGEMMKKEHDRYALHCVMKREASYREVGYIVDDLIKTDRDLSDIATDLLNVL